MNTFLTFFLIHVSISMFILYPNSCSGSLLACRLTRYELTPPLKTSAVGHTPYLKTQQGWMMKCNYCLRICLSYAVRHV